MPTQEQLLQYCAVGVPDDESVDLRELAIMLLADAVASEVRDSEFHCLRKEFLRPQEEICEIFTDATQNIDIEPEIEIGTRD